MSSHSTKLPAVKIACIRKYFCHTIFLSHNQDQPFANCQQRFYNRFNTFLNKNYEISNSNIKTKAKILNEGRLCKLSNFPFEIRVFCHYFVYRRVSCLWRKNALKYLRFSGINSYKLRENIPSVNRRVLTILKL